MVYAVTNIDPDVLDRIQAFEKDSGVRLLALNALDVKAADVKPDTLADIQALEKELGVTLVAVN